MENAEKIILGTVQFGLDYGIASEGRPGEKQVFEILDYAYDQGIRTLDTAYAYGNAYELIGKYHASRNHAFDIITKFKLDAIPNSDFQNYINKTLKQLNVNRVEALLYHGVDDFQHHKDLRKTFDSFKKSGLVNRIGFSIYTNDQFRLAIDTDGIDIIQLPYNLLDNLSKRGALINEAKDKGKIVHTRSVFLQGLFFKDPSSLPVNLKPLTSYLKKITEFSEHEGITVANLAMNYPFQNKGISGILLGVDNLAQLKANLEQLGLPLNKTIINKIDSFDVSDESLLNPSNWK